MCIRDRIVNASPALPTVSGAPEYLTDSESKVVAGIFAGKSIFNSLVANWVKVRFAS